MSTQKDDCYFFFYSTCSKGDACAFRHCEAALGNETVCTLWEEGRCFRQVCKFRHMSIDKKRSEIPCYWENQVTGCQKGNCAFLHFKGRFVDGVFLPPSKTSLPKPEPQEAEPQVSQHQLAPKLTVAPTPQLRSVKKMESSENVPSPTHPPVVINAADDDEDDDDQFSEGEEMKISGQQHPSPSKHQGARVVSARKSTPKKVYTAVDGLNFGVKTLEQIKAKKHKVGERALRASTRDHGTIRNLGKINNGDSTFATNVAPHSVQMISETVVPVVRTVTFSSKSDQPRIRLSLSQRLGKRPLSGSDSPLAVSDGECPVPVKKCLSERLGKKVVPPADSHIALQNKVPRLLKDRLGLLGEQDNEESGSRPLKDRLGIPCKNSVQTENAINPKAEFRIKTLQEIRQEKASLKPEPTEQMSVSEKPSVRARDTGSKQPNPLHIKTFSEIQLEKRRRQMKEGMVEGHNDDKKKIAKPLYEKQMAGIPADKTNISNQEEEELKLVQDKVRLNIRSKKEVKQITSDESIGSNIDQKNPSFDVPQVSVNLKAMKGNSQPIDQIRVKTLEEIRREKALRLQQTAQPQRQEVESSQTLPSRKRLLRIPKSPVNADKKPRGGPTEPSIFGGHTVMDTKSAKVSLEGGHKTSVSSPIKSPLEKPKENSPSLNHNEEIYLAYDSSITPTAEIPKVETSEQSEKSTMHVPEQKIKGKPRVNVEPRVVKNRSPAKSAVKRKAKVRLAVAAVKPLSPVNPFSETEQSTNKTSLISTETPLLEDPINRPSPKQLKESLDTQGSEAFSPSTSQVPGKTRRLSTASAGKHSLSTEDDFDNLIWEISDGKLEAEIDLDPSKDEDDLLLELSEMIDS